MKNRHALQLLQFERILEELREYCLTVERGEAIADIDAARDSFVHDGATLARRIALVTAYRVCLSSLEEFPAVSFPDLRPTLPRIDKPGSVLEAHELRELSDYLASAMRIRRAISPLADDPELRQLFDGVPDVSRVTAMIDRLIDDAGELKERDIPELRAIRGRQQAIRSEIRGLASGYFNNADYRDWFNSDLATQKDGRTVLPLKAQYKGRIRGIVHEVSTSGATVFVEPLEIVERNNDLVEQENKYRQEVLRILRDLTKSVAANSPEIHASVEAMEHIDAVHCRARYSLIHLCSPVHISDLGVPGTDAATAGSARTSGVGDDRGSAAEGKEVAPGDRLALYSARHPLLGRKAVPVDIVMDEQTRTLIITGPNTGGKTVSLKTAGLLALMHQFAMEIPAGENSSLPLFDDVLADIGDEQSIEQSLSTFSGHMQNISRVLRHAGPRSLVLLDELGAGTDPEEGSALAMAIMDELIRRNVFALITTHHTILKNYGYTRPGVKNASMEFDRRSLSPTYRIILGVPGSSHAIEIASANGIPDGIIQAARGYLEDEQTDAAGLIRRLTQQEQDIHRRGRNLDQERSRVDARQEALEERERELARRELDLKQNRVREFQSFVAETRRDLEKLVKELREGQLTREKTRDVKQFIDRISRSAEEASGSVEEEHRRLAPRAERIEPGMEVLIGSTGRRGTVLRRARGSSWVVATGAMRVTLSRDELRPVPGASGGNSAAGAGAVEGPERQTGPSISVTVERDAGPGEGGSSDRPAFELDVRGRRLEEALSEVSRQIDLASMHGMRNFSIIHGKGEGVLQKGIREYLADSHAVEDFAFARPEEGGFGKTVVTLRA